MSDEPPLVERFEEERPRLVRLAHGMLGNRFDADERSRRPALGFVGGVGALRWVGNVAVVTRIGSARAESETDMFIHPFPMGRPL